MLEKDSEVRKEAVVRALPCLEGAWFHTEEKARFVERWLSTTTNIRYTQEIGQSVVEVLLRMACVHDWRRHLPAAAWVWLERRPTLPPVCWARALCCNDLGAISVLRHKNVELLTAYLIVVWSEWDWLPPWVCSHMCSVIREVFGGQKMRGHRDDLRRRLQHIQGQFDHGLDHLWDQGSKMLAPHFQPTKEAYEELMKTLSDVERLPEVDAQ
jgi:hypothetical protein